MLYYLFRFLDQFGITGAHIWSYISFRSLLALILSLIISAWFGEKFIKYMKRRNISEVQRDASIDPFGVEKKGVPTMGGIIIIIAILVPAILLGRMRNIYLILMIITTVWLGFLGFLDDYIKIFRRNKEGLKGKYKIVGQVSIGLIVGLVLYFSPDAVIRENTSVERHNQELVVKHKSKAEKSLKTTIPFIKNHNLDYSEIMAFCGKYKEEAGWILFVLQYPVEIPGVSMTNFMRAAINERRKYEGKEPMPAGEFIKLMREKRAIVELDSKLANRSVNEGFSGGEKKRNEIFQMAMLEPKLAILDETDSGLDVDAMRIVAEGVNKLHRPDTSTIVITHYDRLLDMIKPDVVHVLYRGRIVKTAGPELAKEIQERGYDWIKAEAGNEK